MSTRRTAKIAQAIRQVVSSCILFELRDPRIKNVTVIDAEVGHDLRTAKIHVSVMGDPGVQHRALQGLDSARGFLQAKIADQLQLRYTPVLTFALDDGVKRSIEVSRLLRDLEHEQSDGSAPEADDDYQLDDSSTSTEESNVD